MSLQKIIEVNDNRSTREFLTLPQRLYKGDPNWIRPLDSDIEDVFDRKKNKLFRHGDAIRFLAVDDKGETTGRVAAFYNDKTAGKSTPRAGGIGFFESIRDRDTAFALFDQCREWLISRGMEAMDGPINFGDRDRWWGLLVDGLRPPNYCMPYNFLWYKELFEEYGFNNYFEQYTYYREVNKGELNPVIQRKADRITDDPDYSFRHITRKTMSRTPRDFMTVYNKAWAGFQGGRGISEAHAKLLFKSLKPVIDTRLLWFGYYRNEPVCFFLMLPEINPVIKRLNGKLNLAGKIKFLYHRHIARTVTRAFGLIFGVVPEHQKRGVEGALIAAFAKTAGKPGFPYRDLEFNWIGDFNPSMIHLLEQIGARKVKTHITYRYLFDRDATFRRATKVNI